MPSVSVHMPSRRHAPLFSGTPDGEDTIELSTATNPIHHSSSATIAGPPPPPPIDGAYNDPNLATYETTAVAGDDAVESPPVARSQPPPVTLDSAELQTLHHDHEDMPHSSSSVTVGEDNGQPSTVARPQPPPSTLDSAEPQTSYHDEDDVSHSSSSVTRRKKRKNKRSGKDGEAVDDTTKSSTVSTPQPPLNVAEERTMPLPPLEVEDDARSDLRVSVGGAMRATAALARLRVSFPTWTWRHRQASDTFDGLQRDP
jgi:hypothetical protein